MYDDFLCGIMLGVMLGAFIMGTVVYFQLPPVSLSQESADAICYNLTSIEGVKGLSEYNKLVCEVPSFDSTSEIIVRTNGERK